MKTVKSSIGNIIDLISLSTLSRKYFGKDRSWLYHKLNEDIVNGKQYEFTDNEIEVLIHSLSDVSSKINISIKALKQLRNTKRKQKGAFFTDKNPFTHPLFKEWMKLLPTTTFLEPFAGSNNILTLMNKAGFSPKWKCYDIAPPKSNNMPQYKVVKRDCLKNFPTGYKISITNPPYLAKSSATRQKLVYPTTLYDDLYKFCLDKMLHNCDYIAAIIPESFVTSNLFHDRLYGIISLNIKISYFTNCPVCLALFVPNKAHNDFVLYSGDAINGTYNNLKKYVLNGFKKGNDWTFNVPNGNIGVKCVDGTTGASIYFCRGELINPSKIKPSSRTFTRVSGLPSNISLEDFINKCNTILNQYRKNTKDIFLTSFKGLRKDGKYRRRIDFNTIRKIMNEALAT